MLGIDENKEEKETLRLTKINQEVERSREVGKLGEIRLN